MIPEVNNPPKVSVILPFYNSENTLEKSIQSIVNQSFIDLELILIDNASDDDGLEISRKWTENDSRIKLYNEKKKGVVFAANLGLEKAKGKYIARMDADDVSLPNRIERQVQVLEKNHEIGLVSGLVKYTGDEANEGFSHYVNWSNGIIKCDDIYKNQFVEYPLVNPSIMFKRELYERFGGYMDGDFPEDYEFFLRLQMKETKMTKVDSPVLEWSDLPTRLSRTDERYSQEAFFKIKAKYLAQWLEKHNPNHPEVIVWGGGKLAKKRSTYLKDYGIRIGSFIDVKKSKHPSSIYYKDIHSFKNSFILSFVTNRGARKHIRNFLNQNGFQETINYLICA